MNVLVFGKNGWIGSMVYNLLLSKGHKVFTAQSRANDMKKVEQEIVESKCTHVLCAIGRTSGGNINTIDYLQDPSTLSENIRDNLYSPLVLAVLCTKYNVHLTYIGTGCIFDGYIKDGFTENDSPNFFGSNYSIVKGYTDEIMKLFDNSVLNLRIRMPIHNEEHKRNFITKITSYSKVCSNQNSMTVLPSLLPYMIKLMEMKHIGTLNFTNPGMISHNEILTLYKMLVDPHFIWDNFNIQDQNKVLKAERSNNYLNTSKLETLFPDLPRINDATYYILNTYKKKSYDNMIMF
jgi:dTDP-4-dehydrorhamnose reductase